MASGEESFWRLINRIMNSVPEILVVANKEKLAANGLTEKELGVYVDILMDGRKIDDYSPEGMKQIDLAALFTLFVIPSLLAFVIRFERSRTDENE